MELLRIQYNKILNRINKGVECCERLDLNNKNDKIKFEKYADKLLELFDEANTLLLDIESTGYKISSEEVNNGFKIKA